MEKTTHYISGNYDNNQTYESLADFIVTTERHLNALKALNDALRWVNSMTGSEKAAVLEVLIHNKAKVDLAMKLYVPVTEQVADEENE